MKKALNEKARRALNYLHTCKENLPEAYMEFFLYDVNEYHAPENWRPGIEDLINEIANMFSGSYEEYLFIGEYLIKAEKMA